MATMLEKKPVPERLQHSRRALLRRLDAVRRRLRLHLLVEGLFWVTSAVAVAAGTSLLLDRMLVHLDLLVLGLFELVFFALLILA